MKLLIQADDYGISPGVSQGILYGINHGLIRNTGIFMNMPWSEECANQILPLLDRIALGIDLNITTGSPLLPGNEVPTLVRSDGSFYSSWESRKLDQECEGKNHASDEDVRKEFSAQIEKYMDIFKKKPDYLHAHAYTTERIVDIQRQLAGEYQIPYSVDVYQYVMGANLLRGACPWYRKPATLDNQVCSSLKDYIMDHSAEFLRKDIVMLVGHMGYVDPLLFEISSYTLYRLSDLGSITSNKLLRWVKENGIELITYKNLM